MTLADRLIVMNAGVGRADRHADGRLRPAGHRVRRRLHRLAGDELPGGQGRAGRRGRSTSRAPARQASACRWRAPTSAPAGTRGDARHPAGAPAAAERRAAQFDVELAEPLGADTLLHGRFGEARELVTVRQGGHVIAKPGERRRSGRPRTPPPVQFADRPAHRRRLTSPPEMVDRTGLRDLMLFGTYNIHYGVGADGRYDVPRIADAVADADIVCLQETVRGFPPNDYADHTAEIGQHLQPLLPFPRPDGGRRLHGRADGTDRQTGAAASDRPRLALADPVVARRHAAQDAADGAVRPAARLHRSRHRRPVRAAQGLLHAPEPRRAAQRLPQVEALMKGVQLAPVAGGTWDGTPSDEFHVPGAVACRAGIGDRGRRLQLHARASGVSRRGARSRRRVDAPPATARNRSTAFPREGRIDHVFVTPDLVPKVRNALDRPRHRRVRPLAGVRLVRPLAV